MGRTLSNTAIALCVSNQPAGLTPWGDGSGGPGPLTLARRQFSSHRPPLTLCRALVPGDAGDDTGRMAQPAERNRFRHLPESVRPEDVVETVDTTQTPPRDEDTEERDRLLRHAGGL